MYGQRQKELEGKKKLILAELVLSNSSEGNDYPACAMLSGNALLKAVRTQSEVCFLFCLFLEN